MPELTPAEKALKALTDATLPLAKSVADQVAEARAAFNDAVKYDGLYSTAITKAGMPEQFMKKPGKKKMVDGKEVDDEDKKDGGADEDCDDTAKAEEIRDLAKAAHEVVLAYLDTAEDTIEKAEDSLWAIFAADASKYYSTFNGTLEKQVEEWRAKAAAHRETMAKADGDDAKAVVEAQAAELDALVKSAGAAGDLAKSMVAKAVFPRPELKLAEPLKLETPVDLGKGADWMPIQTKGELMAMVERYKGVAIGDRPPVYAHIFNAAKALGQKLPIMWHAPTELEQTHSKGTGSDQTARVTAISEADKAAAMAKGVTVIGPTAGLLSTLRSIGASTLIERMTAAKDPNVTALKEWMTKGDDLLKGIVAAEAESIRILDIPTFPEAVLKADHWATVAAKACVESLTDDMPVEQRTLRKELAGRLDAAAEVFKKSAATDGLSKADTEALATITAERDDLKGQLEKFTTSLVPLTRAAQAQKEELKKVSAERDTLKAENTKLLAEPMASKGRVGEGNVVNKADDGSGAGNTDDGEMTLEKADALPAGSERNNALIEVAYKQRLLEKYPSKRRAA